MGDVAVLVLACAAGVALGGVFFGGLWWTVQKMAASTSPALWMVGSLLLRTVAVLAGFWFVAGPRWQNLLACLVGFLGGRVVVNRLTATKEGPRAP